MTEIPHVMLIDEGTDAIPPVDDGATAEAEGAQTLTESFGGRDAYREGVAEAMGIPTEDA